MSGIFSLSRLIRDPVPTSAALPIGTDMIGAIRVVLADSSVWVYNGTSWQQAGGGGGGTVSVDNSTIYYNGSTQVAIKPGGITDNLINNSSSIIKNWSGTITYAINQMVIFNRAVWIATQVSTNIQPSLNMAQWKQIANEDSAQYYSYSPTITSATYNMPSTDTSAIINSSASDIIVNIPAIASLVTLRVTDKIRHYVFIKIAQENTVTLSLSGSDVFLDGTTSYNITNKGVYSIYALFNTSIWAKG